MSTTERCDPGCIGWAVFNSNEIQRCDECARLQGDNAEFPDDLHAAAAALQALAESYTQTATKNNPPWGGYTQETVLLSITQTLLLHLTDARSATNRLISLVTECLPKGDNPCTSPTEPTS